MVGAKQKKQQHNNNKPTSLTSRTTITHTTKLHFSTESDPTSTLQKRGRKKKVVEDDTSASTTTTIPTSTEHNPLREKLTPTSPPQPVRRSLFGTSSSAPQTTTTEKKQDDKKQDDKKQDDKKTTEQTQLSNEKQYQPLSKQAAYLKTKYTTRKLNTVSAAIRKVIAAKYLLPVDKIIFVTPRTIRKTTSGKKSRAITVRLAEDHYLDHRIIAIHNSKALETYYQLLKEAGLDVAEGVKNNQQASTLSSNDKLVITSDKKND